MKKVPWFKTNIVIFRVSDTREENRGWLAFYLCSNELLLSMRHSITYIRPREICNVWIIDFLNLKWRWPFFNSPAAISYTRKNYPPHTRPHSIHPSIKMSYLHPSWIWRPHTFQKSFFIIWLYSLPMKTWV
jgi:hypothetical protein